MTRRNHYPFSTDRETALFLSAATKQTLLSPSINSALTTLLSNVDDHDLVASSCLFIFRKLSVMMKVPYYTTTTYPGARLVLDDQGLPVYQGLASPTFTVRH